MAFVGLNDGGIIMIERATWAEVNLDNLKHNIKQVRKAVKAKEIMAAVKADAYGHGAVKVAKVLLENGADRLAVAMVREAIELRKANIIAPILVLGHTQEEVVDDVVEYDIETTVISYSYAETLSKEAVKRNKTAKIHVKLDTGMGRIGYLPENKQSLDEIKKISMLPNIVIEGVFSHLSSADVDKSYTEDQVRKFNEFCNELEREGIKFNKKHIANSAGVIAGESNHYDIVRVGILLYGYYPDKDIDRQELDLKPVMSIKAKITQIKSVHSGTSIGYARAYKSDKETRIATLPIGYADGYMRMLSGKAQVGIKGELAPVIGRICMDQCMVDVTNIPNVQVGDEVIILGESGENKIDADYIAELLGTISYEVICMIGKRLPRVYTENSKITKIKYYV